MSHITVNALGEQCPIPVVKATRALREMTVAGTLTVLVDGQERTKLTLVAETNVDRLSLGEVYKGLLCTLFCIA